MYVVGRAPSGSLRAPRLVRIRAGALERDVIDRMESASWVQTGSWSAWGTVHCAPRLTKRGGMKWFLGGLS